MKKILICIFALSALVSCGGDRDSIRNPWEPDPSDPPKDEVEEFFKDEIKPVQTSPCFAGAYYRKAVSSFDKWRGITGTVKLPSIAFDPNRVNPVKPAQYLDNPSIYLGGNASGQETDIGLTWEVVKDEQGNVSADRKAFRPFLRRTGYPETGQKPLYENAPAEAQYYWYPGDVVTITLKLVSDRVLRFTVEGEGKKYEKDFACDGYKFEYRMQFKRVNAIDQVANEGKPIQPTKTKVENAKWQNTYLFRLHNDKEVKAPMHTGRFTNMRCPDIKYFSIVASEEEAKIGGELITIDGGR